MCELNKLKLNNRGLLVDKIGTLAVVTAHVAIVRWGGTKDHVGTKIILAGFTEITTATGDFEDEKFEMKIHYNSLGNILPGSMVTRSPTFKCVTPSPTALTVPPPSWPITIGLLTTKSPMRPCWK